MSHGARTVYDYRHTAINAWQGSRGYSFKGVTAADMLPLLVFGLWYMGPSPEISLMSTFVLNVNIFYYSHAASTRRCRRLRTMSFIWLSAYAEYRSSDPTSMQSFISSDSMRGLVLQVHTVLAHLILWVSVSICEQWAGRVKIGFKEISRTIVLKEIIFWN